MNRMTKVSMLLFSMAATNALASAPEGVGIRSFIFSGSGCPPQSADMHLRYDEIDGLVLTLPHMQVEWGPKVAIVYSRQNCVMSMDLIVPEGWQYALDAWEAIGTLDLDAGLRGDVSLMYFFEGQPAQRIVRSFEGPQDTDFVIRDWVSIDKLQWSRCNEPRKLSFNTAIRIGNTKPAEFPNASGWMELGRHWESNQYRMRLAWRRCS